MPHMFDTYNNIGNDNPNNIHMCIEPPRCNKSPYGEYNTKGELVGYYWYYGDTVNLQFNISGEITVENNAIVYDVSGQSPDTSTIGIIDQRAYNLIDRKSWTCTSIQNNMYSWVEDSVFTYPENGGHEVYFTAKEYLKGKDALINIYNFRYEKIFCDTLKADTLVTLNIDECLSKCMKKGVYYCTLTIYDDIIKTYIPVLKDKECTLIVK